MVSLHSQIWLPASLYEVHLDNDILFNQYTFQSGQSVFQESMEGTPSPMPGFNEEEIKGRSSVTETTTWEYVPAFVGLRVRPFTNA